MSLNMCIQILRNLCIVWVFMHINNVLTDTTQRVAMSLPCKLSCLASTSCVSTTALSNKPNLQLTMWQQTVQCHNHLNLFTRRPTIPTPPATHVARRAVSKAMCIYNRKISNTGKYRVGNTINKYTIEPTCCYCDKFVLCGLNGGNSACGRGSCWTCNI